MSSSRISGWSVASCATRISTSTIELPYPRPRHQAARQQDVQRRELERTVTDDLDGGAALTERNKRPEYRIVDKPDEEFHGSRAKNHWLQEKTVEPSFGSYGPDALKHCTCLAPDPFGVTKTKGDTADIGLMRDIGREDLQRDRKSDRRGNGSDIVWIPRNLIGDDRDAVGAEDDAGLCRIEPRLSHR
jgi:hypothetical protein